jgi:hypothetical protein
MILSQKEAELEHSVQTVELVVTLACGTINKLLEKHASAAEPHFPGFIAD